MWSNMAYWKIHQFWLVFTRKRLCHWKSQRTWLFSFNMLDPTARIPPVSDLPVCCKSLAILCKWMKHEAQMSSYCIHPKKHHTKNHSWPESRLLAPDRPTMRKKTGLSKFHGSWTSYLVKAVGLGFFTPWSMSQLQDSVNPRTSKLLSDGPFGKWFKLSQAQSLNDRILECIFSKGTWYMSNLFKGF